MIEKDNSIVLKSGLFAISEKKKRNINYMRIRISDPNQKLWYSIQKKRVNYYIVKDNEKGSSKFVTLDIGDLEEEGIQGIAFIRGVLRERNLPIGHKVDTRDWRSQAIRIEYKKLGITSDESQRKAIKLALKRYRKDIINFLKYEYGKPIKSIKIVPKGNDFKLEIKFKKK